MSVKKCYKKVKDYPIHHQGYISITHTKERNYLFYLYRILDFIETIAEHIPITNVSEPVVMVQKFFAISALQPVDIEDISQLGLTFSIDYSQSKSISSDDISFENNIVSPTASISLPSNLFSNQYNISRIINTVFVTDSLFMRHITSRDTASNLMVSSIIISASVVGVETISGLMPPVNISFQLDPVMAHNLLMMCIIYCICRVPVGHLHNVCFGINHWTVS